MTNGLFVEIASDGTIKPITAAGDVEMRVREKTELWGLEALVLDVTVQGVDEIYMVENEWDINDSEEYDDTAYSVAIGEYVKMRRPKIGDQLIISVATSVYTGLNVNDTVTPAANGTVAKKTGGGG